MPSCPTCSGIPPSRHPRFPRHPRLNRGPRRAFGRARGEPLGAELPAAPSRRRPHIPAAVPRSACHPAVSCASIRRTSPSSSLVRFRAKMYSIGTSSSHLGTKSPDFVLNWNLKFALGNKKPRFCTRPQPQVRTWEQKGLFSYSTGTSSSYLGTKSLDFVLNRNLNEMLQA